MEIDLASLMLAIGNKNAIEMVAIVDNLSIDVGRNRGLSFVVTNMLPERSVSIDSNSHLVRSMPGSKSIYHGR